MSARSGKLDENVKNINEKVAFTEAKFNFINQLNSKAATNGLCRSKLGKNLIVIILS